ncbi:MAG: hypothetical protein HGA41_11180 [Syntrophaceae bacterium]|nr:hypothetical protein [Syntrophaceae bacterium]
MNTKALFQCLFIFWEYRSAAQPDGRAAKAFSFRVAFIGLTASASSLTPRRVHPSTGVDGSRPPCHPFECALASSRGT